MEESVTYQRLIRRGEAIGEARSEARGEAIGEARGMRRSILLAGSFRCGEPDPATRQALVAVTDLGALDAMFERSLCADSWAAILGPMA